jgi:hypothetical protein
MLSKVSATLTLLSGHPCSSADRPRAAKHGVSTTTMECHCQGLNATFGTGLQQAGLFMIVCSRLAHLHHDILLARPRADRIGECPSSVDRDARELFRRAIAIRPGRFCGLAHLGGAE